MLEFPIVRSKRRTVGIYMKPDGSFEVRAPYHLPEKQIDAFVLSKLSWITEKSRQCFANSRRSGRTPV